jgi:hypothetical protein
VKLKRVTREPRQTPPPSIAAKTSSEGPWPVSVSFLNRRGGARLSVWARLTFG